MMSCSLASQFKLHTHVLKTDPLVLSQLFQECSNHAKPLVVSIRKQMRDRSLPGHTGVHLVSFPDGMVTFAIGCSSSIEMKDHPLYRLSKTVHFYQAQCPLAYANAHV